MYSCFPDVYTSDLSNDVVFLETRVTDAMIYWRERTETPELPLGFEPEYPWIQSRDTTNTLRRSSRRLQLVSEWRYSQTDEALRVFTCNRFVPSTSRTTLFQQPFGSSLQYDRARHLRMRCTRKQERNRRPRSADFRRGHKQACPLRK